MDTVDTNTPADIVTAKERLSAIANALSNLDARNRNMLCDWIGDGMTRKTHEQLAEKYDVCKERAGQIVKRQVEILRANKDLREWLIK